MFIQLLVIGLTTFGSVTAVQCQVESVHPDKCFTKENIEVVHEYPNSHGR